MDANAWSLVEEDENAEESAQQMEEVLIAAIEQAEKRKSISAQATSRSTSLVGKLGTEVLLAEPDAGTRTSREREDSTLMLFDTTDKQQRMSPKKRKKSRSKSPALEAVESLRKLGHLVMERVKRRKSDAVQLAQLNKARELSPCLLDTLCKRPKEFCQNNKKKSRIGGGGGAAAETMGKSQRRVISEKLLEDDGGGGAGRRLNKQMSRDRCAHLFQRTDHSHLLDALSGSELPTRIHVYDPYCPVHGSRRRLRYKQLAAHRLVDMNPIFASVDTTDGDEDEKLSPYLQSQALAAKKFRKERRALLRELEGPKLKEMKRGILTDLAIISLAFLFLFTGFNGLQTLQTSINEQLGADALCVFYITLAISTLFFPSFLLNRVGCKRTLVIAIGLQSLYFCANFIPRYYSLIPASILAGIAASCYWAAKCLYISESAVKYAKLNVESSGTVIPRFFGFFFMFYHMGQVLGNLLSSLILGSAKQMVEPEDRVDYTCGHNFNAANLSERAEHNLAAPPRLHFLAVVCVDLCCSLLALFIVKVFLNPLQKQTFVHKMADTASTTATVAAVAVEQQQQQPDDKFSANIFRLTLRNLSKPKPVLLIPLTIFNGIEQAFGVGLYTKAYTGCSLGISEIGFVMTSFGVADAICSFVFGPLIKLFGRMPLLMFGAVINLLMIITLMIWAVNPGDRVLFNAVAGVWGMADGVWNTQLIGFWVALMGLRRDQLEVAFANYRFWLSFGLALGFLLIRVTSIDNFLLIAFAFLLVGILGYFMVELFDIIAVSPKRERS